MRYDVVLAGVGGQGVLSLGAIIGLAADSEGLCVKQSETHGMAQRGGAVQAHLRLADGPIASALIARGRASMILATEPLEGLRQASFLAGDGVFVSSSNPVENIPDYPPLADVLARIGALPRAVVVDAERLAKDAGSSLAANVVLIGAACRHLPLPAAAVERAIEKRFGAKGEGILAANLAAFRSGQAAGA